MLHYSKVSQFANSSAGARIAIIDGSTRLSWTDLEAQVRRLICEFSGKPWRRGVFLSRNRWELAAVLSACSTLGIPLVGLDYTASADQTLYGVRAVKAEVIFYSGEFEGALAAIRQQHPLDAVSLEEEFHVGSAASHSLPAIAPRPFESLSFTSGTTGFPKIVVRTKSFDARRFADLRERFQFDRDDVFLATIPFYHVSVLGWARLFLDLGGNLVIAPVDRPQAMAAVAVQEGVTAILATPRVLESLCEMFGRDSTQHRVKFVITGGKHLSPAVRDRAINVFGPVVHEYYGTTETGLNAIATTEDLLSFPGSPGRTLPGNSIVAVDAIGRPLPDDCVGRIAISSYQTMDRYLCEERSERHQIDGAEHLVTPDVGCVRDGRVFLKNRTFRAQSDIDLYALEDGMRALRCVRDAFALATPDDSVVLFLAGVLPSQRASVTAELARLAAKAACVAVCPAFVERIPYNPSGKPRLQELEAIAR